jgi:hypothetical protein
MVLTSDVRLWVQFCCIAALALAAWRWGGGPERVLAGLLLAMAVTDQAYHALLEGADGIFGPATAHVIIDLAALVVSLAVALSANRVYSLWFAALQMIAAAAHLTIVMPSVATLAYRLLYVGPSYLQIMLLAGGLWLHRRRVRRHGSYRPWRSSSHLSPGMTRGSSPNV